MPSKVKKAITTFSKQRIMYLKTKLTTNLVLPCGDKQTINYILVCTVLQNYELEQDPKKVNLQSFNATKADATKCFHATKDDVNDRAAFSHKNTEKIGNFKNEFSIHHYS